MVITPSTVVIPPPALLTLTPTPEPTVESPEIIIAPFVVLTVAALNCTFAELPPPLVPLMAMVPKSPVLTVPKLNTPCEFALPALAPAPLTVMSPLALKIVAPD
jgi:hypothetical protein